MITNNMSVLEKSFKPHNNRTYHKKEDIDTLEKITLRQEIVYKPKETLYQKINNYINEIIESIIPEIYIKHSLGKEGKTIKVYKLQTMIKDADTYLNNMLNNQKNFNHQGKLVEDFRVTKKGKILRKYHLDELPQIYNLIKGNMKLVGVRPMQEEFWNTYPEDIKELALKQKPGLCGVNYIAPKGLEHFEILRTYLKEYEKNPILTDIKYFYKIWHNILINGERSI